MERGWGEKERETEIDREREKEILFTPVEMATGYLTCWVSEA